MCLTCKNTHIHTNVWICSNTSVSVRCEPRSSTCLTSFVHFSCPSPLCPCLTRFYQQGLLLLQTLLLLCKYTTVQRLPPAPPPFALPLAPPSVSPFAPPFLPAPAKAAAPPPLAAPQGHGCAALAQRQPLPPSLHSQRAPCTDIPTAVT